MKPTEEKIKQPPSVAVIGMGCLFPQAPGLKNYWRLLFRGHDAITDVPETHWLAKDYYDTDPKKPDHVYCKRGGFISPVSFDPTEFGIPPSSLEATDTAQLLGLLVAKKALDHAGYGNNRAFNRDKTSVILGVTGTQELVIPLGSRLGHPHWRKALEDAGINPEKTEEIIQQISDSYVSWQENSFPGLLGNVVAGRISNRLNLGGTNCVVDAACASSLSAIHLAILELLSERSDMVITGGVDTLNDIFMHMCFSKTMALSPTGDIRPFSNDADGTVLGEGIGIFVLKRLEDAEKDGDRIYAVIKGMGTSSDGKSQSIYSPRAEGQIKALQAAYSEAGFDPSTIEMIEAHGTGTKVGDLVEFQALNQVFGESGKSGRWCALGSVKSMIGHTKAAAGAAGLMKAVLSLHNKVLLPTLKVGEPNTKLNIEKSPFYLNRDSRPWFSKNEHPRRSGISSFGFGGSNFHLVVEEYKKQKQDISWDGSVEIVALSASNQKDLKEHLQNFKRAANQGVSFEEISEKAEKTRNDFKISDDYRLLMVIEASTDLESLFNTAFDTIESKHQDNACHANHIYYGGPGASGKIAFVFPGQGSQYEGMGRDLVNNFPDAFQVLEQANEKYGDKGCLTDFIYPQPPLTVKEKKIQQETLRKTDVAQPAIGAVSMSMLKVLHWFGVKNDAACGHSFGEFSALCAADWIDLDTLLHLSITRGRLMAAVGRDKGTDTEGMLAVQAPLGELDKLIRDSEVDVVLANRNSPNQGVLSGPLEAIEQAANLGKEKGFKTFHLPVSAAFHSSLVKDAQEPFARTLKHIAISPSQIPVFSNTTGKSYPADADGAKQLLREHLLSPVDFVSEIENLYKDGVRTFVEVGPKSILTGLIKAILKNHKFQAMALDDSSGKRSGMADLAKTLCYLASLGHAVDLNRWEQPVPKKRKQLMSIPIAGVNFRNQEKDGQDHKTTDKIPSIPSNNPGKRPDPMAQESRSSALTPTNGKRDTMKNKQHSSIYDALKVMQEGLKTMQILHTQTAETHQKFLETQTKASRSLQNMMENAQRLAEASAEMATISNACNLNFEKPAETIPVTFESQTSLGEDADQHITAPNASRQPAYSSQNEIENKMLEVVSNLTGYPAEMLSFDMDIEADLGIDSIKRVEILSALEDKMPELPAVSPEIMGTLKTLGQILDYLTEGNGIETASAPESNDAESPNSDHQEIKNNMLEVVSRLTGYPAEMLSFDMDIEADLGIDSIKRVEILSALENKMPELPAVSPEIMGTLKTLGQILDYLSSTEDKDDSQPSTQETLSISSTSSTKAVKETPGGISNDMPERSPEYLASTIGRKVVSIVDQPLDKNTTLMLPDNRMVFVTDDRTGLSEAIVNEFNARGIHAALLSEKMCTDIVEGKKVLTNGSGLVIVPENDLQNGNSLKKAFLLTKHLAQDLFDSAEESGAIFGTVTRLDGAFGFKGIDIADPLQGSLAGLAKTASQEWKKICCHAIDISPEWKENKRVARAVVNELLNNDPSAPIEIGLDSGRRHTLALEAAPFPSGQIKLGPDEVVVITGGAKGISASVAYALAIEVKPTLVLIGRSPLPKPEPVWLSSVEEEVAVKKAIFEHEFSSNSASPIQLENAFKAHMSNREITRTLEKIRTTGAKAIYYQADVGDADKIKSVLDDVRSAHGPIKAVIHGAGVLEDRRIVDKTIAQFDKVFDTKVTGLKVLLEATRQDNLSYLILFSSIAARVGNNGQADYAMANEALNKIAQKESVKRPDCKVISINWGPWDGGMVCSALKRKFEQNSIQLIPLDTGAMCMINEMKGDKSFPVEVVIGANMVSEKGRDNVKTACFVQEQHFSSKDEEPLILAS